MHVFRHSFINQMSGQNKVILNALRRQKVAGEANERAKQKALQIEAVVIEPQAQPPRVEEACGPPEQALQLDGGNDIDGLSPNCL